MTFAIRIVCSPVLFVKLTAGSPEAQHGLLVLEEALMQVACVELRNASAFPCRARRDFGQLLAALVQDGPMSLAHGQDLGRAAVGPAAGLAQQLLQQSPAEAVGLDDKGDVAEKVRAA